MLHTTLPLKSIATQSPDYLEKFNVQVSSAQHYNKVVKFKSGAK